MSVSQSLQVTAIPAFDDNYLWLIHDQEYAAIVDPGDAAAVEAALAAHQLKLAAILLTHHHADHAGGVPALVRHWHVPVYGPASERIPGIDHPLREGDVVTLTSPSQGQHWLFCGDTLFAGGCGRLFEGTAEQMTQSLGKIAALPDNTKVYCAHEYTVSNLRFAVAAEPDNQRTAERLAAAQTLRAQNIATVPSTVGEEKLTNPFLRYREKSIANLLKTSGRLNKDDPVAVFAALREWKNVFR
jgi:hydroxyacylglutathione hydrolase